jgi:hypothetical protein
MVQLKQKQISELKNENMMTVCTPEKENNYLLWMIHIIKYDSFTYKCTKMVHFVFSKNDT